MVANDNNDNVNMAMEYVSDWVQCARKVRNLRQSDLSAQSSRISKMEAGSDVKLSYFFTVLNELNMLDKFLNCLPDINVRLDRPALRVRPQSPDKLADSEVLKTGKLADKRSFLILIDQYPSKDIPVSERTANQLSNEGFAIRVDKHEGQLRYLATTLFNAEKSQYIYRSFDGELGGWRHSTLVIADATLSAHELFTLSTWINDVRRKLNTVLEAYKIIITDIGHDSKANSHLLYEKGSDIPIKASIVNEAIEDAMRTSMSHYQLEDNAETMKVAFRGIK